MKSSFPSPSAALKKTRNGIAGFDEMTGGGLPRGRSTLLAGGAGCGKTIFALQFFGALGQTPNVLSALGLEGVAA